MEPAFSRLVFFHANREFSLVDNPIDERVVIVQYMS